MILGDVNLDIRREIKNAGIKMYQIAYELGCNDGNFSRKLRKELNECQKNEIRRVISKIKK